MKLSANTDRVWGEKRGLNPRQPESQSGALPTGSFHSLALNWRLMLRYQSNKTQ